MASILSRTSFAPASAPLRDEATRARWTDRARALLEHLRGAAARLGRRRAPPLELELTDRFVDFRGVAEFEFALASRSALPAPRVRELMTRTARELEAESARIREIEHQISGVLARAVREPGLLGELFRELALGLFSDDHGWREIIEGLRRSSPRHDGYKRVALVKYLQYLCARQQVLRRAFVLQAGDRADACLHATRAMDPAPVHTDTGSFEPGTGADGRDAFRALPKGETVAVDPGRGRELELLLAGNRMRLYTGRECYLVDDAERAHPLAAGRNVVGRHAGCAVVVDAACRSVSRTHLVIEPVSERRVLLTDLSAHGTEVRAALLPR